MSLPVVPGDLIDGFDPEVCVRVERSRAIIRDERCALLILPAKLLLWRRHLPEHQGLERVAAVAANDDESRSGLAEAGCQPDPAGGFVEAHRRDRSVHGLREINKAFRHDDVVAVSTDVLRR